MKYNVFWNGLDRGHEGYWNPVIWYKTLKIVGELEESNYKDLNSPLYTKLQKEIPEVEWFSKEANGVLRSSFRDAREPWQSTNVLEFSNDTVKCTPLGEKINQQISTYSDALVTTFKNFEEEGEYPFVIIASAFSELGNGECLTAEQVANIIMPNYRPGKDRLSDALLCAPENNSTTQLRRIRNMLQLLIYTGAITKIDAVKYVVSSKKVLSEITGQYKSQNMDFGKLDNINRQLITYGAPGTGKSHKINKMAEAFDDAHKDRVTFYPTYTYQQFIGTYKPIMEDTKDTKDTKDTQIPSREIAYDYVPGPFLRLLIKALLEPEQLFLIIIEEINRANAAAVFGDFFQLLDRKKGKSEYPISISEDMKRCLIKEDKEDKIKKTTFGYTKLSLPSNFLIWATMNSADQGVFPIDTAFKRRWDFEYIGINDKITDEIKDKTFTFTDGVYKWNTIREAINNRLLLVTKVNEDKLIGPFFIPESIITSGDNNKFLMAFKSKVLMYLFEDAARHNRTSIFKNDPDPNKPLTYSNIIERLEKQKEGGLGNIFAFTITKEKDVNKTDIVQEARKE